jgi:acetolactate synthase-1/2/3 large subunit
MKLRQERQMGTIPAITESHLSSSSLLSSSQAISGASALMAALIQHGVKVVFGYPGGAIMPIYDAHYHVQDTLRHVLVRHEQGAVHAAEGYARMSGEVGVCMATSGPGATNLVTGIADAMMDSVPLLCISGQVNSWALGTDAFQETDIIGITIPITKWNYQITRASEIPAMVAKAFLIANSGRPGPVLLDITKNAQTEMFHWDESVEEEIENVRKKAKLMLTRPALNHDKVTIAASLINNAKRPLLLVGHGALISRASKEVEEFALKANVPVALTLHGLSAFPTKHPLYVGMLGMHGNYGPNVLTNKADVIIAVGMRFDDRVTGDVQAYAPTAKVIHIEIDPAEIGKVIPAEVGLIADAKEGLSALIEEVKFVERDTWLDEFKRCEALEHDKVVAQATLPTSGPLKMSEVVWQLSQLSNGEAVIVADVGQHQMMAARYYQFNKIDSWITSGGLGTMGFALPAAMGAKAAKPQREIIVIVGDGGFQMNSQELMTISQENFAVKVIILNNNFLGMVRQWQELFFENRYSSVAMQNPDFIRLGEAYFIKSARVDNREDLPNALTTLLNHNGPYLLEVKVETEQNVFPMVPAGASISDIRLE